jgi:hypothetical protein
MKSTVNSGNFTVVVDGTLRPEAQERILAGGVKFELHRGGLSSAWLALAGTKNDKGTLKLPDKFERDSIEFSEEAAATLQDTITGWATDEKKGIFMDANVTITKNEGGEKDSPQKRATALVDGFLGTPLEAPYRAILGDGDREALIAKAHEMGLGVQPPRKKAEANGDAEAEEGAEAETES